MQRVLIIIGIIILLAGILWPWLIKLPIGKLPGDIIIDKPNFKVYIPITTMIIISLLLTLIFWLFRK
jgi:membrane protein implicated in regulation of membrane protease activity